MADQATELLVNELVALAVEINNSGLNRLRLRIALSPEEHRLWRDHVLASKGFYVGKVMDIPLIAVENLDGDASN